MKFTSSAWTDSGHRINNHELTLHHHHHLFHAPRSPNLIQRHLATLIKLCILERNYLEDGLPTLLHGLRSPCSHDR
jgi:hypothetical protein